jgi:hypothetical protein
MYLRRFFEEYMFFPFENTDLMDAMAMAEALHEDYRTLTRHKNNEAKVPESKITYQTINGKRVMTKDGGGNISKDGTLDLSRFFKPLK